VPELGEGTTGAAGPLAGVRVIECGSLIAGPFCGQLLGDFGAEVIKVEDPAGGDPMRAWGPQKVDGLSLHWPIIARNKKSVTANLREEEGQLLLRQLAAVSDILIENFRPGTLERWGPRLWAGPTWPSTRGMPPTRPGDSGRPRWTS
jgi:formyl-CoA transferase